MRITVAKSDLEVALTVAGNAVDTSSSDLSSHYLFRQHEGKTQVLAYGPRLFACADMVSAADGEDGDAFTVEAWRLDKWMAGCRDGALTFTSEGSGDVKVSDGRSTVRLRSLDPSKFPFWDGLLAQASEIGRSDSRRLTAAIGMAKNFVSSDDTAKPELCQIEAVDGVFWSTDRRALCSIEVPTLPELSVRIPGKDVGAVTKFLSDKHTMAQDVIVKVAERSAEEGGGAFALFERPDAYLGVSKPSSEFPRLNVNRDEEVECSLTLDMAELDSGIKILQASAPKGHESVTFTYAQETGIVSISMPSEAGGTDDFPLSLAKVTGGENFDVDFTVDYPYMMSIVDSFGLEQAEFAVKKRGRGGYVSFKHEDEGESANSYFAVVVWRT